VTDKNITILDDFLSEKELKILTDNLNKVDYHHTENGPDNKYGFGHKFYPDETNKWLFDKIKNKFFPDKNLKPTDCSFRLRHNANKVLPHKDDHVNYLFLCYLKGEEKTYNGTGFYNHNGELDRYIGFVENRALFFDSHIFHTDLQALGDSSPRYTLNIFYEEE
tara:strand:- start:337 stop:828 length:492 start_codon:yes stop_codon:yes gene_type:complete